MARSKRKRDAPPPADDPPPTARRRRSQMGNELTTTPTPSSSKSKIAVPEKGSKNTTNAAGTADALDREEEALDVKATVTHVKSKGGSNRSKQERSNGDAILPEGGAPSRCPLEETDVDINDVNDVHDGTNLSEMGNDHAEVPVEKTVKKSQLETIMMAEKEPLSSLSISSLPSQGVGAAAASAADAKFSPSTSRISSKPKQTSTRRSMYLINADSTVAPTSAHSNDTNINNNNASTEKTESTATNQARIRDILEHRKLLLLRVRQAKSAAQKRIDFLESTDPTSKTVTDEQETLAFQEMVRTVHLAVRKQARADAAAAAANTVATPSEQRSVSLRRGSSVAKRTTTTTDGSQTQQHGIVNSLLHKYDAQARGNGDSQVENSGILLGPVTTTVGTKMSTSTMSDGVTLSLTTTAIQKSGPGRPPSVTGYGSGPKKARDTTTTTTATTTTIDFNKTSAGIKAAAQHGNAVSGGSVAVGPRSQREQYDSKQQAMFPPAPRVICPETSAQRERRDEIRIQLAKMLQDRHHRIENVGSIEQQQLDLHGNRQERKHCPISPRAGAAPGPLASPSCSNNHNRQTNALRNVSHVPLWQSPDPGPQLPLRRKTQWDIVLDEMRWMATDFIEERKWKHSTARVIGNETAKAVAMSQHTLLIESLSPSFAGEATFETNELSPIPPSKDEIMEDGDVDESIATRQTNVDLCPASPRFVDVSEEDSASTRQLAKTMSTLVSNFIDFDNDSIQLAQSFVADTGSCMLEVNDGTGSSTAISDGSLESVHPASNLHHERPHVNLTALGKTELLERTSHRIDAVLAAIQKNPEISDAVGELDSHGFNLSPAQASVVMSVEDRWQQIEAGAVIHGPASSGKTVAVCSLLWRQRSLGPQLLICSALCMIRWLHELDRLVDLNVKTIDSLIASAEDFTNFTGNDIFICEYSLITKVDTSFLSKFRSVVVDCRYPSGFSASRTKDVTSGKSSLDAARASFVVPDELSSDEWWSKLVFNTNVGKTNRLLIDSFPAENIVPYLSFLSKRQFMELLALRTAFLMGKNTFVSPFSIGKTILSWARHRIKQTDSSGQSKFQLVKTFLISLIIPCYCSLGSKSFLNGDDLSTSASISCEVHKCRMTASQQSQYDRVCRQLNSILSGGLRAKKVDDFNGIADAFVSIRRICTHADIISALRDLKIQPDTLSENERPPSFGPELRCFQTSRAYESQPDALLARRLLSESSKFSHLLTLLRYESAGSVVGDFSPSTRTELSSELHTPKHAQISKKIVILAVLPEIQFLASVLLGSVGIEHELLLTTRSSTSFHASSSIDWSCEEIREWNRSQSKLSKFNSDAVGGRSAVNVVIAAPITVAGDHCGLGVEEADVIVLLDEDWSGRGELFTRSLLSRCKCRKELHGGGKLRFIRLVAEDSCEAFFLSPRQETCEHSALVDNTYKESFWQTSAFGAFISPMKNKGYYNKTSAGRLEDFTFCFPGRHLLLTRNIRLSNILCVTNTQPLLQSSTEDRFLSVAEGDDHVLVEMTMLQRLIEGEEVIGDFMYRIGPFAASFTLRPAMPPLTSKKTFCQLTQQRELDRSQLRRISRNSNSRDMELLTTGSLSLPKNALRFVTGPPNTMIMDYSECDALVSTMSPTERAFSVLFYDHEAKPKAFQADAQLHQPRVNIFSGLFSSSDRGAAHDGSQGSEALVYFPPVFPRMQECASLAKKDTETIWPPFLDKKSGLDTVQHVDSSRGLSGVPDSERLVTEDEASYSDAASVLLDSFDDYGLAGIGAVPFLRESVIYAGNASRRVTTNQIVTADSTSEWISSTPVSDLEEFHIPWKVEQTGCNPCSVVVYVTRKRQRGSSAQAGRSAATLLNGTSIPVTNANIYRDHNGLHKKGKKPVLGSSFNRLPTTDSLQQAQYSTHRKDDYRHRLLSSLRQSGTGTTIFESPAFQAAAVRLRNKVSKRIFQSSWTSGSAFDTGSGLPLVASKQHNVFSSNEGRNTFDDGSPLWTSVIKRLQSKDATTGREAIELSTAQQLALKQSRSAPCRVDFGPFQCGFLSCPSGMIFSVQPKQRVGVSLPMGVKIVSSSFDQDLLKWTADEDIMLITAVKRFGMNWILVARLLSGCHDISVSSLIESKSQLPMRATRSCRDRWQRIASSNSRLVGGMPLTEHYHETTNSRLARAVDSKAIFLVPTTGSTTNSDDSSVNVTNLDTTTDPVNTPVTDGPTIPDKRKKRRGFTAFQVAQAMKYSVPLSIPGVAAGSPPDSHPSHDQAVQTSISAAWTGRPTDMWPLQLLDAADKHRAKTKAAMDSSIAANPIRQTMSSSSSRNLTSNGVAHSISRSQPVASVPHSHRPSSSVSIVQSTSLRSQKQMNRSLSQSNGRSASTVAGGSPPLVPPSVPPTLPSVFPANSVPVSVDAISSSSRQSFVPPPSAFPVAPTSTATSTGAAVTPKSVVPIGIPATNVVSAETTTNTSSGNVNNTPITPAIKPVLVSSVAPADKPIVVAPVAPAVKPALLAPVAPAVKPILIVPVAPAVKPVQGAAAVVAEPIVESRPENPPVVVSRIEDDVVRPEQPQAKT